MVRAAGQPEQPPVSIESLDSPSGGSPAAALGPAPEGIDALLGPALADAAPAAGLGGAPVALLAAMGPATLADVGRAPLRHAARCGARPAHGALVDRQSAGPGVLGGSRWAYHALAARSCPGCAYA